MICFFLSNIVQRLIQWFPSLTRADRYPSAYFVSMMLTFAPAIGRAATTVSVVLDSSKSESVTLDRVATLSDDPLLLNVPTRTSSSNVTAYCSRFSGRKKDSADEG